MELRDELLAEVGPKTHVADLCGRAADALLIKQMKIEQLERQVARMREDRPFVVGWNDGYATAIDHAADEVMTENQRRLNLASIRIPAMACEIRDAILKLKSDHDKKEPKA